MIRYLSLFRLSFVQNFQKKKDFFLSSLSMLAPLAIFGLIIEQLSVQGSLSFLSKSQLLWYITWNFWFLSSLPDTHSEIYQDIKRGLFLSLQTKPLSYLHATFIKAYGTFASKVLIFGFLATFFTRLQVDLLPFSPLSLLSSFLLALLAGAVMILLQMVIGFLSLFLQEIESLYWIIEKLLYVFGGIFLPLSAYPEWLHTLANWTPFPSLLGDRSMLLIEFSTNQVLLCFSLLIGWGLIAGGSLLLLYNKAAHLYRIERKQ